MIALAWHKERMMAENNPFEISPQIRELAEKNVEQVRQFYEQWMQGVTKAMSMWSATPAGQAAPGFDGLQNRAVQFAKDNAEAAFALAQELAQAKDLQHLMTLQSQYAQAQMKAFTAQTQELGHLLTEAMQNMRTSS
jgi:hypothetical protein